MKKTGLLSNCLFIVQTAVRLNPTLLVARIPLVLVNAAQPFIPIVFLRLILNEITMDQDMRRILWYVLSIAAATLAAELISGALGAWSATLTEATLRRMRNRLGEAIMEMPFALVEEPRVRDFISLAKEEAKFSEILDSLASLVTSLLTVIGLVSIIVTVQPLIFLLVLAVVAVRLLADWKNRKLWDKWRPRYEPIMRKVGYFFQVMKNTAYGKEVRLNKLEEWLYEKVNHHSETYIQASTRHNTELQKNNAFAELTVILQESVVYLLLACRVVFTGMPIGDFSMYMTSINTFSTNVRSIVSAISALLQYGLFAKEFRYCLEQSGNPEQSLLPPGGKLPALSSPLVLEFRRVSFAYPHTERLILKDVSLTLREGESLSIVGMNGAGKTTFVKLLCRLYQPTEGEILLNGINIAHIPYSEYLRYLGVVFQDFQLFAFSMRENITLQGSENGNTVEACVEKSGLTEKLASLPQGLETNLSKEFDENGIEFSGGEAQKLALARALYKNAPIMVLDEPTSALDPLAEYEVYHRFHEFVSGKCAVYISHRLSSTRFTDKIAVFSEGRLAEYGNHEELIKIDQGIYAALFRMQAQYYV